MKNLSFNPDSSIEKQIEQLQQDTVDWDKLLQITTEEFSFLKQLLSSDVFELNNMAFFETLHEKVMDLEDFKTEKMYLHVSINNHKNDLNGMRECEDVNCELFYHSEHEKLKNRALTFLSNFQELKLDIYSYIAPHFRKLKHQHN